MGRRAARECDCWGVFVFAPRLSSLFASLALVFLLARPTLAQTSLNMEEIGRIALPPVPPESPPGLVSDLWVKDGFAYVARYRDLPLRVEVYDATTPTAPAFLCSTTESPTGEEVEDVVVEGQFLFAATQDQDPDIDGVLVHNLGPTLPPVCNGTTFPLAGVQSAHDLFLYTHSNGTRLLIVATMMPDTARGVHIFNVNNPASPTSVAFLSHPFAGRTPYCDPTFIPGPTDPPLFPPIPNPPGASPCAPHDIYAQQVNGQDLLVVATLTDGVYLFDITTPASPVPLAHFNYFWSTPDLDGDTLPDACDYFGDGCADDTNFDGTVDDLDKLFVSYAHDARITPDGQFLWTADEKACGGHILTWDLAQVLATCSDTDGCRAALPLEIAPVDEYWVDRPLPTVVHQLRWYSANYAFVPWYEEGLRVLGITNDPTAAQNPASSPLEMGFYDSLQPNTDSCLENGTDPLDCSTCTGAIRVLNTGFGGDWGVSWDDCYAYIADRGSPDNNEAPGTVGSEGALLVLRYTGGPTTPQPLRITKSTTGGNLIASWGEVPFAATFNVYRGTIPSGATLGTRPVGTEYDHTMFDATACDVPPPSKQLTAQFVPTATVPGTTYYYLVTARSPCDPAADRESNYGQNSFGVDRPVAAPTCPL
jgi:hypothetical protein